MSINEVSADCSSSRSLSMGAGVYSSLLKMKISTFGYYLLFLFLLFENPLESVIPAIGYFDEVIFILLVGLSFISLKNTSVYLGRDLTVFLCSWAAVVVIGLLGNWQTGFQSSIEAIFKEILAFSKFLVGSVCALYVFRNASTEDVLSGCDKISKLFVLVCTLFALVNLINPNAGFGHDVRHGLTSYKFIYSHPTFLVFSLVMAFIMMESRKTGVTPLKVLCLILLILTMRDKAFGFVGFVIAAWIFNLSSKKKMFPYLIVAGILVLIVAWPKIAEYISYSNSPREALYATSFSISMANFPLGGGFASIASTLSGEFYSSAYTKFGLSNMTGLTTFDYYNTGDAGFAYYLGQFGFIGFGAFLLCLFILYKVTVLRLPLGDSRRSAALYVFAYLVIALTVETSLTNATGIMAAILLSLICGADSGQRK